MYMVMTQTDSPIIMGIQLYGFDHFCPLVVIWLFFNPFQSYCSFDLSLPECVPCWKLLSFFRMWYPCHADSWSFSWNKLCFVHHLFLFSIICCLVSHCSQMNAALLVFPLLSSSTNVYLLFSNGDLCNQYRKGMSS